MTIKKFIKKIKAYDGIALIDKESSINYYELSTQISNLSNQFFRIGLRKNDVVCFVAKKDINTIIIFLALLNAGIGCCPINEHETYFPPHTAFISKKEKCNDIETFILRKAFYKVIKIGDLPTDLSIAFKGKYLNSTSGSTGTKKYAIATWNNIFYNAKYVCEEFKHSQELVYMSLFSAHMHICESFLRAFYCGGTAVLVENMQVDCIINMIVNEKINHIECVPSQLLALKENIKRKNIMEHILIECAGGILSLKAEETIREMFPNAKIVRSWGSSEGSGICLSTFNSNINVSNSIGKVIKGYQAIIDADGQLFLKGKGIVRYIYHDGNLVDFLDFYKTGDIVFSDKDGNFYILGRISNMIKSAGENIYPFEIEHALNMHNDVEECAVVGISDDFRGEQVVAWVTISHGKPLPQETELKKVCIKYLRKNQLVPKRFHITYDRVPKNSSGKTNISQIKDFFEGGYYV